MTSYVWPKIRRNLSPFILITWLYRAMSLCRVLSRIIATIPVENINETFLFKPEKMSKKFARRLLLLNLDFHLQDNSLVFKQSILPDEPWSNGQCGHLQSKKTWAQSKRSRNVILMFFP